MLFAQKKRIAFDTLRVPQNNVTGLKFLDKERIGFIFDHLNSITNQTHADSPFYSVINKANYLLIIAHIFQATKSLG